VPSVTGDMPALPPTTRYSLGTSALAIQRVLNLLFKLVPAAYS
jgi:hypothetical protein